MATPPLWLRWPRLLLVALFRWLKFDKLSTHQRETRILITGLLIWLVVQGTLVNIPLWNRAHLPEIDDSHTYIIRAPQMLSCFFQDCAAMDDLRAQLHNFSSGVEPGTAWQRYRAYNRVFVVYHPLFTIVHLGIKQLAGLSWEEAYRAIWSIAPLFFGIAFGLWLRALWGAAPAGIALAILAFQVFPVQGLHFVVPSNLTLGIAALVWAHIVSRRGQTPWTLAIGGLILILMHPIGRIYTLVAAGLMIVLAGFPRRPKAWLPFLFAACLVGVAFVLPLIVERPELKLRTDPWPPGMRWQDVVVLALINGTDAVGKWARGAGSVAVAGVGVVVGFRILGGEQRKPAFAMLALLTVFLLISLAYVFPRYPADLFLRLWVPVAVFLTGAIGAALWRLVQTMGTLLTLDEQSPSSPPGTSSARSDTFTEWLAQRPPVIRSALLLVGIVALAGLALDVVVAAQEPLQATIKRMKQTEDVTLSMEQPALLLARANPGDRVLYLDEIPRMFYLTHGALHLGAIHYPGINGSPEEAQWLQRPDLRFAVMWDPLEALVMDEQYLEIGVVNREGAIPVEKLRWMELELQEPVRGKPLRVLVTNRGGAAQLVAVPLEDSGQTSQAPTAAVSADIPPASSGWISLDLEQSQGGEQASSPTTQPATRWRLLFSGKRQFLRIRGLVFGDDSRQWPWEQRATLRLVVGQNLSLDLMHDLKTTTTVTLHFDPQKILPDMLADREMTVLDDEGASVLVEIQ